MGQFLVPFAIVPSRRIDYRWPGPSRPLENPISHRLRPVPFLFAARCLDEQTSNTGRVRAIDCRPTDSLGRRHRDMEATADSHPGALSDRRGISVGSSDEGTRTNRRRPVIASSSKTAPAIQPQHFDPSHEGQGPSTECKQTKPGGAASHCGGRSRREAGSTATGDSPPRMERQYSLTAKESHRYPHRQTQAMGVMEAGHRSSPIDATVRLRRSAREPQNRLRRQLGLPSNLG